MFRTGVATVGAVSVAAAAVVAKPDKPAGTGAQLVRPSELPIYAPANAE